MPKVTTQDPVVQSFGGLTSLLIINMLIKVHLYFQIHTFAANM